MATARPYTPEYRAQSRGTSLLQYRSHDGVSAGPSENQEAAVSRIGHSGRFVAKYSVIRTGVCASVLALACGASESVESLEASDPASSQPAPPSEPAAPGNEASVDVEPESLALDAPAVAPPVEPEPASPEPAARCDGSLSFDDLYAAIDADLRREGDDASFLRYVSLSHRYNQGLCPEDLEGDRQALLKTLNSLSTEVSIVQPEAIDDDAVIYRIDLRDLGWDQPITLDGVAFSDKWEAIIATSPYAVELEGDDADSAKLSAQTAVPVLLSDALVDATMVGDLYYELVGIGADAFALFTQLGIDFADVDVRAGTSSSRMSQQDTIVQRFEQGNVPGFYWSRFDVADENGGQSVFADPLGFQGDVISSLFTLPNGFIAYALFDAAGARIAETGVLVDRFQRDGLFRNSVSCSACHAAGVNAITDEVRSYVEDNRLDFDADTFGDVEETFVLQPELDAVIAADNRTYAASLLRAGLDTGAGGDPVSRVYQRFDGQVTLAVAAGELGITPEALERDLVALSREVDPVLVALSTRSLRREQFEGVYLATLCALLVSDDNLPAAAACDATAQ